jgi:hypothetical protein
VVQQPPRRLVVQGASSTTSDEDQTLTCDVVGEQRRCTPTAGVDYAAGVADEIAGWRTAIEGDAPIYAVDVTDPGCFELQLVRPIVSPPYGSVTILCFDDATGALSRRQTVRDTGTDTEEATEIRPTVTDADWAATTTGG